MLLIQIFLSSFLDLSERGMNSPVEDTQVINAHARHFLQSDCFNVADERICFDESYLKLSTFFQKKF